MRLLRTFIARRTPLRTVAHTLLLAIIPTFNLWVRSEELPIRPVIHPAPVEAWISKLSDDHPRVRSDAANQILRLAENSDPQQDDALLQSLLRAGLTAELELQMVLSRLVDKIREHQYERTLAGFLDQTELSDQRLAMSWQTFSTRALSRADSRHVFAKVAMRAGPSLDWETVGGRRHRSPETAVLVSHLGCVAPVQPKFFQPESDLIFAELISNRQRVHPIPAATEEARVLDRLLDATITNNPYGWTVQQRLRLALLYHRHAVALEVGDSVMRASDRLPTDWTAAMMAFRQVERYSGWIEPRVASHDLIRWSDRIEAIVDALEDSRVLAVQPTTRWVPVVRKLPPPPNRQANGFQSEVVRTRVQDVAAWILVDRNNLDARNYGMPQLEADFIWGVHRASIGFTSDHERESVMANIKP